MSCKACQVIIVEEAPYLETYFGVYVTQARPPLPPSQNLILNGPRQYVTPPVTPPPPPPPPAPPIPPEIPGPQDEDPGTPNGDPNDNDPTGPNTGGNTENPGGPPLPPDTPNNPDNREPEVRDFGNDPVYYVFNACPAGQHLEFSGALPQWVTFDDVNGQFVGLANVFRGETQAIANEAAQSEINSIGESAVAAGEITCVPDATCPSYTGAVTGFNELCVQAAYDPINDWVFIGGFTSQMIHKVDPATNTILASTGAMGSGILSMIYVPGPTPVDANPAILFTVGSDLYHLDPTTMTTTLLTALSGAAVSSTMAYGPNLNEVIIPIGLAGNGCNVYVMVLGFGALIHIPGITVGRCCTYNPVQQVFYSTNFDAVTYPGADLLEIDETTLNVTRSLSFATALDISAGSVNNAYCASNGKVYVATHNSSTSENKVYVVDAATLTVDTTIALDTEPLNSTPLCAYSSELDLIIVGVIKSTLATNQTVVIDPASNTVVCTIEGTRMAGAPVDVASNASFYFNVRRTVDDLAVAQLA